MFLPSVAFYLSMPKKKLANVTACAVGWVRSNSAFSVAIRNRVPTRVIHNSAARTFFERYPKSGYEKKSQKHSRVQLIRDGLKELRHEIGVWKEEVKEKLLSDPIMTYRPEETDIVWKLNSPESLSQWVTTSDSDHGEGYSNCSLTLTPGKRCLFSGTLKTDVPKDGKIKKAGYCNMKSIRVQKSFKRDSYYDWGQYTHIVLRVRGDGRTYLLNLSTTGYYDIMWNDVFHYALFTRGGPYWQVTKIPFSKFFLGSKGRVQDKQSPIPLNKVTNVGISVGDALNGPFNLEIDYIGLEVNPAHHEEFAYEMYHVGKFIAGH